MRIYECDWCGTQGQCRQTTIDGTEYDQCEDCQKKSAEVLKGKGRVSPLPALTPLYWPPQQFGPRWEIDPNGTLYGSDNITRGLEPGVSCATVSGPNIDPDDLAAKPLPRRPPNVIRHGY